MAPKARNTEIKHKICGKCLKEFPILDFIPRANWCRKCLKEYNRELYLNRKSLPITKQKELNEKIRKSEKTRTEDLRRHYKDYLRSHPCNLCGESDICTLEANHIERNTKEHSISNLVSGGKPFDIYLVELAKTEVLCVNCHKLVTHEQNNSWLVNNKLSEPQQEKSIKGTKLSLTFTRKKEFVLGSSFCWYCKIGIESSKGFKYCSKTRRTNARSSAIRYCGECDTDLPQENFRNRSAKCLKCNKDSGKEHYINNPKYYKEKRVYQKNNKIFNQRKNVVDYLYSHPCIGIKPDGTLCGESRIGVLEFDHLDGVIKVDTISNMVRQDAPWPRIEAEIAKCQILCANCHRRRTHIQIGTWASKSECPDHRDEMDDAPPLVRRPRKRDYPKIE